MEKFFKRLKNIFYRCWYEESAMPEFESNHTFVDGVDLVWMRVGMHPLRDMYLRRSRLPIEFRINEKYYPIVWYKRILWFVKVEKVEHEAILRIECEGTPFRKGAYYIRLILPHVAPSITGFRIKDPSDVGRLDLMGNNIVTIKSKSFYASDEIDIGSFYSDHITCELARKETINLVIFSVKEMVKKYIKEQVGIHNGWVLL